MEIIRLNIGPKKPMTPIEKAKAELDYARRKGGFAYKQAKAHYDSVLRAERRKGL